jgi:hypothetical protein
MQSHPFTPKELTYLAHGARALAGVAKEDASRQDNPAVRAIFECEERTCRELAAKCDRLATEPAAPGVLELPVIQAG